jgi:hypothetical protein
MDIPLSPYFQNHLEQKMRKAELMSDYRMKESNLRKRLGFKIAKFANGISTNDKYKEDEETKFGSIRPAAQPHKKQKEVSMRQTTFDIIIVVSWVSSHIPECRSLRKT